MNTYRVTVRRCRTEVYEVRATSLDEAIGTWALGQQVEVDEGDTEVVDAIEVAS